jgi:hypothetical protein
VGSDGHKCSEKERRANREERKTRERKEKGRKEKGRDCDFQF